jgi:hypothetical protein
MKPPTNPKGSLDGSVAAALSGFHDQTHPPPPRGPHVASPIDDLGIPLAPGLVAGSMELLAEWQLVLLLKKDGAPTNRAARAACRRWAARNGVPTLRLGQTRLHPVAAVMRALRCRHDCRGTYGLDLTQKPTAVSGHQWAVTRSNAVTPSS